VLANSIREKLYTLPGDYVVYPGHEEGARELQALTDWATRLDPRRYDALLKCYMNQPNDPPRMIAVKKKA
jgi:glyoxylase-like metal-dependent hydrolase (beta-lactamase superfamily II)